MSARSGGSVQAEARRRVTFAEVVDAANEVLALVQLLDSRHHDSGGWTAARALNRRRQALVTVRQELHTAVHDSQRRWALAGLQTEAEHLRRDFDLATTTERSPS
jgi:DNA-binding IscR family transcriptional regulator